MSPQGPTNAVISGHGFSEPVVPLASPPWARMPPCFIMVCVLTHLIQGCVSSHISFPLWGKSLLHILPVIMEQKPSPEVPWLMHFLLKFSILDQIHTSRSLASKCFRKVHNFVGGQTKGKWLRMALGRPKKQDYHLIKHLQYGLNMRDQRQQ